MGLDMDTLIGSIVHTHRRRWEWERGGSAFIALLVCIYMRRSTFVLLAGILMSTYVHLPTLDSKYSP